MLDSSSNSCTKCGAHIETQWKFCPLCGVERERNAPEAPHAHAAREEAPVKSGFSGLFFGLIAAPVFIMVGVMICMTGLGIVLGIPLIVAGVLAPVIGPIMGVNAMRGTCPWCGGDVSGVGIFDKFSCPKCNHHIARKNREMLKAE